MLPETQLEISASAAFSVASCPISCEIVKSVVFQRACSLRRVLIVRATTSIVWMMAVANPMVAMTSMSGCSRVRRHSRFLESLLM